MNIEQIVCEMERIDGLVNGHTDSMARVEHLLSEIAAEARYTFGDQKVAQDLAFSANQVMQLCNQVQHSFNLVRSETKDYIAQLRK